MPILLPAQGKKPICDSSISVCPDVFDDFIKCKVLSQKYYIDNIKLLTENNILVFKLQQKDSLQQSTSNILEVTNEQWNFDKQKLLTSKMKVDKLEKNIKWLKFGCVAIPIVGIGAVIYVSTKK